MVATCQRKNVSVEINLVRKGPEKNENKDRDREQGVAIRDTNNRSWNTKPTKS